MKVVVTFMINIFFLQSCYCYWDKDRENTENPQHDNNNCNSYCRNGIPNYMNWKLGLDFIENQGIARIIKTTKYGPVEGLSVPGVHDTSSFVNIFLGIPYAKPPVGIEMFKVGQ